MSHNTPIMSHNYVTQLCHTPIMSHNTPIIYVDGACRYNGTDDAISAIGIWISENEGYS